MQLNRLRFISSTDDLALIPSGKIRISTLYAYSFAVAQTDTVFEQAISTSDILTPDGQSIVWATRFLHHPAPPKKRIAGWDLFTFEMGKLQDEAVQAGESRTVMFVGSSGKVLDLITERAAKEYPNLQIATFSPPFKSEFSDQDNAEIIQRINAANPDLLWIGMTAPKQEKWLYTHWEELDIHCHCGAIGAVFDFYAGTVKRAPVWMQKSGLEWLHRLCSNPAKMWRRYLVGNAKFIAYILKEKFTHNE